MPETKDRYDLEIEYLMSDPKKTAERIYQAWGSPFGFRGGLLFQFVSPNGRSATRKSDAKCPYGCLTQIRGGYRKACTPELTEKIVNDSRIPEHSDQINVSHLSTFAEWQRLLDKEIRNGGVSTELLEAA